MVQTIRPKLSPALNIITAVLLVWVPSAAFLTVWLASLAGHYTTWRLAEDALVVIAAFVALLSLFKHSKLGKNLVKQHIVWLIAAYVLLEIGLGLVALARHDVSHKALGYGLDVDLRFLLFFIVCLIIASYSDWLIKHWQMLVLIPAGVVIFLGLFQHFILPMDFLSHFGYNSSTILPYETVNSSLHYLRVFSTLRGSNPFGAYLVLIISLSSVLLIRAKDRTKQLKYGLLILAGLIDLFFTYSRSAWIGLGLSLLTIAVLSFKWNKRLALCFGSALAILILLSAGLFVGLRNNMTFQNDIFHTSTHSSVKISSNQNHASALRSGLSDALHQPLGRGPGTAGPASVYNYQPARIPENYFVQIAEEIGWLGLIVFLLIYWLVAKGLYFAKTNPLALGLLAALVGITFINFLSQAWTDNTLSYLWWGLAGIALAPLLSASKITGDSKKT
jgi:hypothetical protein